MWAFFEWPGPVRPTNRGPVALEGEALAAFKAAMVDSDQKSLSKTNRSLTTLYESGLALGSSWSSSRGSLGQLLRPS